MSQTIDRDIAAFTATILNGQALSNPIDFRPFAQGGLIMPAAWTVALLS